MSFCGRDYEPDGHEKALPKGDGTITPVFVVEPAGWQVYKQTWGNNGPECPVILLLQRNNHDVVVYSLLGGP